MKQKDRTVSVAQMCSDLCRKIPGYMGVVQVGVGFSSSEDYLAAFSSGGIETHGKSLLAVVNSYNLLEDPHIIDDAVRGQGHSGITFGFAVGDCSVIERRVTEWLGGSNLEGECRPWALGYWIPEAFLGDLATSVVIDDPYGWWAELIQRVSRYPDTLAKRVFAYCALEISRKKKFLLSVCMFERSVAQADIGLAVLRIAFANEGVYLRGFRDISEQAVLLSDVSRRYFALSMRVVAGESNCFDELSDIMNISKKDSS